MELACGESRDVAGTGRHSSVIRAFLMVPVAFALAACTAPDPAVSASSAVPRDAVIYVIGRGWHTDIGLPVSEIASPLKALAEPVPGVRYLTFGFGDRTYLLNRDVTVFSMLTALLPGRGALLVTALRATPAQAFGTAHVVTLHVTRTDRTRLEQRLWQEFRLLSSEAPVVVSDGPYPGSLFYAASAPYSGVYTCNTWTAAMIQTAGLPMPTGGLVFASQVMGMARWIATQQE
jgi:uncharacterized protein (TIGR02117 family)